VAELVSNSFFKSNRTAPIESALALLREFGVQGRSVLEFGCGVAPLTSIACSRLGASNVCAIDRKPEVVELARTNVESSHTSVQVHCIDWCNAAAMRSLGKFDLLIGADILYDVPALAVSHTLMSALIVRFIV
jgi:predicted nicotinamide N-methyase